MNIKNFITKLRNLPDKQKNIILWVIVAILGIIMVFFWFNSATKRISKIGESIKTIELPQIENQIPITETQKDETADWKIYTNNQYGFDFKYPDNFWGLNDFKVFEKKCSYSDFSETCPNTKDILGDILISEGWDANYLNSSNVPGPIKKSYADKNFCLYGFPDAAAGTTYVNEFYIIARNQKCLFLKFITPYPNCYNYLPLEENNTEQKKNYENCLNLNQEKPKIMEKIISTFKFTE